MNSGRCLPLFLWNWILTTPLRTALRNHNRILLIDGRKYWKVSSFRQARVEDILKCVGGQNIMKHIGVRYDQNPQNLFCPRSQLFLKNILTLKRAHFQWIRPAKKSVWLWLRNTVCNAEFYAVYTTISNRY